MAKKLNTHVHAVERDDKGNITNSGTFGPDSDLSAKENSWVEAAITNPDVWDDDGKSDNPPELVVGDGSGLMSRQPSMTGDSPETAAQPAPARPRPPAKPTTK